MGATIGIKNAGAAPFAPPSEGPFISSFGPFPASYRFGFGVAIVTAQK